MSPRLERGLYVAGVVVGLAAAAFAALGPLKAGPPPRDAMARVDGVTVGRADYQRAIEALEADKRNPLTAADRKLALERLIDEELLIARALELGLAQSEGSVRKALVDAMIQFAMADAAGRDPTDAELRRFFDDRPDLFAGEPLLRVQSAGVETAKLEAARAALRSGPSFAAAMDKAGASYAPIPDAYLSPAKLADYAGPGVSAAALALQPGEVGGPLTVGDRAVFVWLIDRRPGQRPAFETVRTEVAEEWRRHAQERALQAYVQGLRRKARVELAADAPK